MTSFFETSCQDTIIFSLIAQGNHYTIGENPKVAKGATNMTDEELNTPPPPPPGMSNPPPIGGDIAPPPPPPGMMAPPPVPGMCRSSRRGKLLPPANLEDEADEEGIEPAESSPGNGPQTSSRQA